MINKYNIAELSLVDRPIDGTKTGFGAVINRHPDNHAARYFNTENRDAYGEPQRLDANQTVNKFKADNSDLAGTRVRPIEDQGIHKISNLVGEVYSKKFDP